MSPARALAFFVVLACAGCAIPRWPVNAPLTSPFGLRMRGILPEIHRGVDITATTGTEVRAMTNGRVRFAGSQSGYGNVVWIDHGGAVITVYAHLSRLDVATGQSIRGGDLVGLSGSSGDVTAPHLHFEIWRWGRQVDPVPLLGRFPGS